MRLYQAASKISFFKREFSFPSKSVLKLWNYHFNWFSKNVLAMKSSSWRENFNVYSKTALMCRVVFLMMWFTQFVCFLINEINEINCYLFNLAKNYFILLSSNLYAFRKISFRPFCWSRLWPRISNFNNVKTHSHYCLRELSTSRNAWLSAPLCLFPFESELSSRVVYS